MYAIQREMAAIEAGAGIMGNIGSGIEPSAGCSAFQVYI